MKTQLLPWLPKISESPLLVDQANVTVLPLADADLTHTVYMGYIRDKYQIPAVKRFIQFVKRDGKAY